MKCDITIKLEEANGKAVCNICNKPILNSQLQITALGHKCRGDVHYQCVKNNYNRQRLFTERREAEKEFRAFKRNEFNKHM